MYVRLASFGSELCLAEVELFNCFESEVDVVGIDVVDVHPDEEAIFFVVSV